MQYLAVVAWAAAVRGEPRPGGVEGPSREAARGDSPMLGGVEAPPRGSSVPGLWAWVLAPPALAAPPGACLAAAVLVGESRGFAYVQLRDPQDTETAKKTLDFTMPSARSRKWKKKWPCAKFKRRS